MSDKEKMAELLNSEIARTKARVKEYRDLSQPIAPENSIGRYRGWTPSTIKA